MLDDEVGAVAARRVGRGRRSGRVLGVEVVAEALGLLLLLAAEILVAVLRLSC
jgi:hypothetical protein